MTTSTLAIVCGMSALAWSIVLYKGRALWKGRTAWREQRDPTPWAYWGGFLFFALALTLPLPPFFVWIDQLAGVQALGYLLGDTAALLTFWIWLAYYQRLSWPDPAAASPARRLAWIVAGAVGFMSLRFIAAPGHLHYQLEADPAAIYMVLYRLVFLGVIALHLHHTIARLHDYAATTRTYDPALDTRLQLLIWSSRFGLAFVGYESLRVIPPPLPDVGGALLSLTAVLLLVTGLTVQIWFDRWNGAAHHWARLTQRWHWLRHYRAFRAIYPLWHALYPVKPSRSLQWAPKYKRAPEGTIIYPPLAARLCWWNMPFHLHRQQVEIRDWSHDLEPYQVPRATALARELGQQAGFTGMDLAAFIEAARLAAALHVWHQTHHSDPPHNSPRHASDDSATLDSATAGEVEPGEELAMLIQVAHHFTHSPLIRVILESI